MPHALLYSHRLVDTSADSDYIHQINTMHYVYEG